VCTLYRRILKSSFDWAVDRDAWLTSAKSFRADFDSNKNEVDLKRIEWLVSNAERQLYEFRHPFPYIHPFSKDGVCWERNLPFPPMIVKHGYKPMPSETIPFDIEKECGPN